MKSGWKGARPMGRVVAAMAAMAAFASGEAAEGEGASPRRSGWATVVRGVEESPEARMERISESLAQCAFDALTAAAWGDGVSPIADIPPGVADELDRATVIALLSRAHPERPRGAWHALRLGTARPADASARTPRDGGASRPSMTAPIAYPVTDIDLERACQLMVREMLLSRVPPDERLPADLVRDFLFHVPPPPTNPAADPALARRAQRLERAGKLARSQRLEAERIVSEFDAARAAAIQWKTRYDALLSGIALRADGEEGRALVAIARRTHAARAGWSPRDGAEEPARTSRGDDEVVRSVRRALAEGHACYALSEVLVALAPIRVARIDSLAISGDSRLRVGRSEASVTQGAIDAWRRACGLERSAVGWTGIPARPRPRLPKIRDAPFGIKPM